MTDIRAIRREHLRSFALRVRLKKFPGIAGSRQDGMLFHSGQNLV
jgi:hypothetical protein